MAYKMADGERCPNPNGSLTLYFGFVLPPASIKEAMVPAPNIVCTRCPDTSIEVKNTELESSYRN